ncbi:hypothetical protein RI129_007528 [Pyrocoelia pectoralis]|uniref:C2H2-type domain-containing protein n=1 Tax=Pyrocoelia pectoralis TaxID=417401 RepID=A0AAN7VE87_9COLE
MELIPNSVCIICNENTSVLSNSAIQPYMKQVENAFFDVDKNNLIQFQEQVINKNFCALCVEKIVIADLFKNAYEDITKKRCTFSKTYDRCFFCEGENGDLLKVNDNPNDFVAKIATFMKSTSYPTSCEGCATCFECFLHANIWYEVYDKINKKRRSKRKDMNQQIDHVNCSTSPVDNTVLQKDKENVTPPHNNIQTINRKSARSLSKPSRGKSNPNKRKMYNELDAYKKSKSFQQVLTKQLKKLKNLRDQPQTEINWPSSITTDYKMYSQIPYVLMLRQELQETYRATRRRSKENAMEVIVLSDSDENSGVKQAPKLLIRRPIKISLSKNFTLETKKRTKRVKLTCLVCDKEFYNFCKYKSHTLWHEKPEHFQINLVRYNLPTQINASDFNTKVTNSSSDENLTSVADDTETSERGEASIVKDPNENESIFENDGNSKENEFVSSTENGDVLDTVLRKCNNSDSEPRVSANEIPHEERSSNDDQFCDNHNEGDIPNDIDRRIHTVDGKKNSSENTSDEVEPNDIIHKHNDTYRDDESVINLPEPQAHSTMFDSDENTTDDIQNTLSELCDLRNKSDDEALGDNENGEINNCIRTGKKRKWNDLSGGNIDQNSGDESTPKRKKVRFALDTIDVREDTLNCSDGLSEHDGTTVNEV